MNPIEDNLNFDKFKAKQDNVPKEMLIEAVIIRDFLKTKNDIWLNGLRYSGRTKNKLIEEYTNHWSKIFPYKYINDTLTIFNVQKTKYNKKVNISTHKCNLNPEITQNENFIYINNITKNNLKFKKEDVILIHNSNPIRVTCKKENYEIHWKIE